MSNLSARPTPKITAVLLASGNGTRFGGDKLLHLINDLDTHSGEHKQAIGLTSALKVQAFVDEVICVVRPSDTALTKLFKAHGLKTIENPDFKTGLSASIKHGVKAAKADNAIMICLGDMPFIKPNSYQSLIQLFNANPNRITRLMYQNDDTKQAGHPVIFPVSTKQALQQLKGDSGAKALLKEMDVLCAITTDDGVVFDIDTQQDLLKFRQ
jgi:molybdenum cofactor cytidylyltransferase